MIRDALPAALVSLAALACATPLTAQEEVDSTRLKVLQRLERLARPVGYDSVLFVQDSLLLARARQGQRSGGAGGDTITSALLSMPGFALTEYEAGDADFDAQSRVLVLTAAEGSRARVAREGMTVEADTTITFDDATGRLKAVGNPSFVPLERDAVESTGLVYDIGQGRGSATQARTTFQEGGARWNVVGDMPFAAPDSTFMSHARFTSCENPNPHYHFETDEIKIVGGTVLVARPVRLYFADVPVAWLPFVAQSLSQGRASGLLTPRFSVNDIVRNSSGYKRRVSNIGFYWAMSDYSDALVAMDWFSDNFLSLTSSLQYKFNSHFLEGDLNFRRYWRNNGSSELALDTRHAWAFDERTQLRMSGRYASSNDFVRDNSFNPAEVTQSIDSQGGVNRRFDWGSLSLGANRKQYLSDDRTEWTLPSANLSLSTITLFRAPSARARLYNNMTWSGGANYSKRWIDRVQPDTFALSTANTATTTGGVNHSLSLGNLRVAQTVNLRQNQTLGVPEALLIPGDSIDPTLLLTGAPARDVTRSEVTWNTSIDYQQQLVGSTTFTPGLTLSGNMLRSDSASVANDFVSGPVRVSFGATLKSDIYGFFPGFGSFETIRHKVSPSIQYQWSPESTPTQLQKDVFGARALQPKNAVSITINQTWEAKRRQDAADSVAAGSVADQAGLEADAIADSLLAEAADAAGAGPDATGAGPGAAGTRGAPQAGDDGPRRLQTGQIVSLLALRTSAVRYDFVEADEAGFFLAGFETFRLSNQISSDYLRGLSVSMDHELFEDERVDGELSNRSFSPHLASVNLSFQLSSRSSIFRWLGFLVGGGDEDPSITPAESEDPEFDDPFAATGATDESSIVPAARRQPRTQVPRRRGAQGGWNASLSYSLQRPRAEGAPESQMLQGTLTLRPTAQWDVSWRTAYDIERGQFNDHTIRLTRDLHRWQANFDFLQTATGNWSFRFEVSLLDNSDLKFDYQQRNLDFGQPGALRR